MSIMLSGFFFFFAILFRFSVLPLVEYLFSFNFTGTGKFQYSPIFPLMLDMRVSPFLAGFYLLNSIPIHRQIQSYAEHIANIKIISKENLIKKKKSVMKIVRERERPEKLTDIQECCKYCVFRFNNEHKIQEPIFIRFSYSFGEFVSSQSFIQAEQQQ